MSAKRTAGGPGPARFLNVDLEVESDQSLDPLLDALDGRVFVLHRGCEGGRHVAYLETMEHFLPAADAVIRVFCGLLESLPPAARHAWDAATIRCFDIGYDSGAGSGTTLPLLAPETALRAGTLGATIAITVYSYGLRRSAGRRRGAT